jgi:hypothetical protein
MRNQANDGRVCVSTRGRRRQGMRAGNMRRAGLWLVVLSLAGASVLYGQESGAGSTGSTVPRLVNFSGVLKDTSGKALTGTAALTLSLYTEQDGGSPLWVETQSVQPDDQGHYTLLLGATQPSGLPLDLFTSGTAQWLGVQPELPGAAEQPRVLLVGMPYALKAVDSDTLGGLPASAFLQAAAASQTSSASAGGTSSATQVTGQDSTVSPLTLGGSGTTDYVPLWTNSTTLGSSVLFQTGTGSTAKLGLNTTTPASLLDVNGAGTVRGTLSLPATGTATSSGGKNSQPASLQASAFNSSTSAAVSQTFHLQAEPTGNDTTSPSGKLNLLFASGTGTPAETGLSIANNGKITFASGQTFPGTGTLTGVTTASGSGLSGGGTTGTLTLGLQKTCAINQVLQWNGSSWLCANMSAGTISGVTAGTDLTGGGTSGAVTLNLDTTKVPQLSAANSFIGNQNVTGNLTATGTITGGSFSGNGSGLTGVGTISGVTAGMDLTGGGTSGNVTLNLDTTKVPQLAAKNTFTVNQNFNGNGNTAQIGDMGCGSGYVGLSLFFGLGTSCTQYALLGDAIGNLYVNRPAGGSILFRENNGNELTIASGGGITATGNIGAASFTGDGSKLSNVATPAGSNTFSGSNGFTGFNAFYQNTTFWGNGEHATIGNMACAANSVGITFSPTPDCYHYALLDYNGSTILNREAGQNMSFREGNGSDQMTLLSGGGVNINPNNHPVIVSGNGTYQDYGCGEYWCGGTLTVLNYTTDPNTYIFMASAPSNYGQDGGAPSCWIDTSGNLMCGGPSVRVGGTVGSAVQLDDGRHVALSAVQSPEDWFEDYGSGSLSDGVATVALEPTFAQTVNAGVEYHVFLTPAGDCEGLYITNKTPNSFEVHELRGGHSSVGFDYKIVVKRKGHENVRLADKTEMYNQMKAHGQTAAAEKP